MLLNTFQPARIVPSRGRVLGLLAMLGLGLSGCSSDASSTTDPERVGRAIQPIIGGVTSGTKDDAVVVLTTFRNGARYRLCTATLVAPNLVLTARHCVSDTDSQTGCAQDGTPIAGAGVQADRDPNTLVVFAGKDGVVPDTMVEANGSARGSKLVVSDATTVCNHDIAFVVLDRKLDTPIAPIRMGPPDETVAAIGWGVDATGLLTKGRTIRANIPLLGVGPGTYPENPTYGYGAREFMVGESACAGDSGGPATTSTGAVVGVASRSGNGKPRDDNYASTCIGATAHVVYTQLAAHQELVLRAFGAAGEAPWLEGQVDPRAVPPPAAPPPESAAPPAPPAPAPPPETAPLAAEAGGCSMSSEPQTGSVEYAAGLVALVATIVGLRRRFGRAHDDELDEDDSHRPRLPSLP